jgi:hypothetical protein
MRTMTLREKIQDMVAQLNNIYDDAEWLRDLATEDEKENWNQLRQVVPYASAPLQKLDNSLSDTRAKHQIN